MFCVYKHTNRINGKSYIGITSQAPERRWQKGKGYAGTYFYNAIQKYGWDNFDHIVLFDGLTKEQAEHLETQLIAFFNTTDRNNGYNVSKGAEYERIRLGVRKYGKDNHSSSPVRQICPYTKTVLNVFESQNLAANALGINRKGITKCCVGKLNTYKGYIWEYADKDYIKPTKYAIGKYPHTKIQKKVKMIDTYGNTFYFDSIKDAAEYVNISRSTITKYINGRVDATGRRWFYALDR